MDTIFAKVAGLDVHQKFITVGIRCRLETGKLFAEVRTFGTMTRDLRRWPTTWNARCDARGNGIDRRPLEAGLEHLGKPPVHPAAGEPSPGQAGTRP